MGCLSLLKLITWLGLNVLVFVSHTNGIWEILHCTMKPALSLMTHIVKDSFDFTQWLEKQCQDNTLLSKCDIKSLFANICHDLFLTAIEYWIEHLQNNLPLLQHFTKRFILEGLSVIFKFNYFHINKSFFYQIKKIYCGRHNLVVVYKENYLQFYPKYTHNKILLIFYSETTLDF